MFLQWIEKYIFKIYIFIFVYVFNSGLYKDL